MSLVTKITGTFLFSASMMFTASTALAGYVGNDPINATDPFGLFADCAGYANAGGGGSCSERTQTTTQTSANGTATTITTITGLDLSELPSKNVADQHYTSNDALPLYIPINSVDLSDINYGSLGNAGNSIPTPGGTPGATVPINQRTTVNTVVGANFIDSRAAQVLGSFTADINGTGVRGPLQHTGITGRLGHIGAPTGVGVAGFTGTIANGKDFYNFEIHQGGSRFRNMATRGGRPGGFVNPTPGTGFDIFLTGSTAITFP